MTGPRFRRPPINEVVCGAAFEDLSVLRAPLISPLFQTFGEEFVKYQERPLLPLALERAQGQPREVQITASDVPPLPRMWLLDESENQVIQIQSNRFLYNWKRVGTEDGYPKFDAVIAKFEKVYSAFVKFMDQLGEGTVVPIQYELQYVNHLPQGEGWETLADLVSVFPDIGWRKSNRKIEPPRLFRWQATFDLPDDSGGLHVTVKSGTRATDGSQLLIFDLLARGMATDTSSQMMRDWFELAHDSVVEAFLDLTDPAFRKKQWQQD